MQHKLLAVPKIFVFIMVLDIHGSLYSGMVPTIIKQ